MRTAFLLALLWANFSARSETTLQPDRIADFLVLNQVYLNERGPYRMMIDTGASASIVRPAVAARLALRPAYAVEMETSAGVKRVRAAILDTVRAGPVEDKGIEVMITDLNFPGADGVLGQSWLVHHDYMLDYRKTRLVLDGAAPSAGIRTRLESADGRPRVSAEVNGLHQELVVDSGASILVLFGQMSSVRQARLVTNLGPVEAGTGSAQVTIGGSFHRRVKMAEVDASPQPGLLPAAAFKSVYISNRDGVVIFVP